MTESTPVETAPSESEANGDVLGTRMPRLDALTGLRWWAAFLVFAHHMGWAPLPPIAQTFIHYGYVGVTFFFVLSGFVLMWSAAPAVRVSTFYWRRFARIFPTHVVALLVALPVFYSLGPIAEGSWIKPVDIGAILLSLVLLQGWSRDPAVFFAGNPPSWSLSYEAFFYAVFPFAAKLITPTRKRGALIFAAGVVAVLFLYRALAFAFPVLAELPSPIVHLTEFVLGMALAWAMRCGWRARIPVVVGIGSFIAAIVVIALAARYASTSPVGIAASGFTNELVTVACALAIVSVASHSLRGGRSLLALRPIVRLGEWSFAFYLVHATLIYVAILVVGYQPMTWLNLLWYAVLLVLSVAASAAVHLLVEKPMERRLRAWKDRRDAAAAARRPATAPLP